jgi:hypothetical protein
MVINLKLRKVSRSYASRFSLIFYMIYTQIFHTFAYAFHLLLYELLFCDRALAVTIILKL